MRFTMTGMKPSGPPTPINVQAYLASKEKEAERNRRELARGYDTRNAAAVTFAFEYFGGKCAVCGRVPDKNYELIEDHFIPIADPNTPGTTIDNIIPLCHSLKKGIEVGCNNSKGSKEPHSWLLARYGHAKGQEIYDRIMVYFESVRSRAAEFTDTSHIYTVDMSKVYELMQQQLFGTNHDC